MTNETDNNVNVFFTSDTWFGRVNILELRNRSEFKTITEMDNKIITNWNKLVKPNDIVYVCTNFTTDPHSLAKAARSLNGHIMIINGGENQALLEMIEQNKEEYPNIEILYEQIYPLVEYDAIVSPYPLKDWPGKETGTLNIHGYTNTLKDIDIVDGSINVSIDLWEYCPVEINRLIRYVNLMRTKRDKIYEFNKERENQQE